MWLYASVNKNNILVMNIQGPKYYNMFKNIVGTIDTWGYIKMFMYDFNDFRVLNGNDL